jgi:hypothetical protein
MEDRSARRGIWGALILQALGYVLDAIWHGLLHPGVEPKTMGDMVRHLGTVHLLLYLGAASVLISTSRALLRQIRRSATGLTLPIAVAGAVLSTGRRSLARVCASSPRHAQCSNGGDPVRHRIPCGCHHDVAIQGGPATYHRYDQH